MALEILFRGSASAKVMDVLWENQETSLSLTEIADRAGIHYTSLLKIMPLLEKLKIVMMVRQVGSAKLFQINKGDETGKRLIKFLNALDRELKTGG